MSAFNNLINQLRTDVPSMNEWNDEFKDQELFQEIRKIISTKGSNCSVDERLDLIIKNIPNIISNFTDCSSEEEFRMLAKREDGSLASIQVRDIKTGFQVYAPIQLDAYNYKKFYYETLAYCVITFILFFKDNEYQILSNNQARGGVLTISEKTFPHLLALENKFISEKDCALLEKIIPGFNSLNSILDKILCIVENNEKIIQYEKDNNIDIFNYYKNMQKNKDFLMLGRFFSDDEKNVNDKNKVILIDNTDNQLCLLKKSNMNGTMSRNICKMIIQRMDDGSYFPRSLQSVNGTMLQGFNIFQLLSQGPNNITYNGNPATLMCNSGSGVYNLKVIINKDHEIHHMYSQYYYTDPDGEIEQVKYLIRSMNGDESIVDEHRQIITTNYDEFDLRR